MSNLPNAVRLVPRPTPHAPIHTSSSSLRGNERSYLLDCIDRNRLSQDFYVRQFERGLQSLLGADHVLACSSGTSALHLALLAHGVGPEDTVIVPALTYIATANAAQYCGARIVFCDVAPDTWVMDVGKVMELTDILYPAGRFVIIPVHLFSALAPIRALKAVLPPDTIIIEDAAHVPGAKLSGHGSIATYSFYGSKVIACGEGGAVATNDHHLASKIHLYRGQGVMSPGRYDHSVIGYNYRLTDMQAAVGCGQLERYSDMVGRRRELVSLYRTLLDGVVKFQHTSAGVEWAMPVLLPRHAHPSSTATRLLSQGIETRPFFTPLPDLLPYCGALSTSIEVSRQLADSGLILPLHPELSDDDVRYVCQTLIEALPQES